MKLYFYFIDNIDNVYFTNNNYKTKKKNATQLCEISLIFLSVVENT